MHRFARRTAALAAALLAPLTMLPATASAEPAEPPKPVNVYTTPGDHVVNGRYWRTTCEQYSAEPFRIDRCRAEILSGGKYVFNNLTYLPADGAWWRGNPLAHTGTFTSAGRQWKTSCADDWTGLNACRSFIWSSGRWVFNNIVNFIPGTAPTLPECGAGAVVCADRGSLAKAPAVELAQPGPWGGHELGAVPTSGLCTATIGASSVRLRCDAARSLESLRTEHQRFGSGTPLELAAGGAGYLDAALLAACAEQGTQECGENHGWGLAVDVDTTTAGYRWLRDTQARSGWTQTDEARPGHFEYRSLVGPRASGWELGVKPAAVNIGRALKQEWPQLRTIYGHRSDTTPDHPSGRAIDVMIPDYKSATGNALGWRIATELRANASRLGISYVIFDERIWSVARDREGWRVYNGGTSDSARHINHVHVNVY